MNENTIRQWWEIFHGWKENPLVEVRVQVDAKSWKSGYFQNVETLIEKLEGHENHGIFATINDIKPACYTREQCDTIIFAKNSTTAEDITHRCCLFLDFDPTRPSGTNATDGEKKIAYDVMCKVGKFLKEQGFESPVVADSGNGYHCLYHIDVPATPEGDQLIKDLVEVLALMFFDEDVKIDKATTDRNRIAKIIGTSSVKGTAKSSDRPRRESFFKKIPPEWKVTPIEVLQKVAARLPKPEPKTYRFGEAHNNFDLEQFINQHGIGIAKRGSTTNGEKLVLDECPFCGHKAPDSAIFKLNNGGYGFMCFHNSCADKTWKDFRLFYDPTAYDQKTREEYEFKRRYGSERKPYTPPPVLDENDDLGPKWKTLSQMKRLKPSDYIFIPSGINALDRKMHGFGLGEITVFSGTSGAGKSTFLNHFALSAIQSGFKTALWTGELTESRYLDWFDQMAAGPYNEPVAGYDDFYYTPDRIRDKIHDWVGDRFYVYNNEYGYGSTQILADVTERIDAQKVKFILLDNLMALDLDEIEGNENEKQTRLIKDLKTLAKKKMVHIILVAHPRKEQTFKLLRKESVAGTANITNLADNVIIAHRVSNDFEQRAKEFFSLALINEWKAQGFSTILEVTKNRSSGLLDYTCGLYYDARSRQILNEKYGTRTYGWDDQPVQTTLPTSIALPDEAHDPFDPLEQPTPFD